jgi:hypothetical protein
MRTSCTEDAVQGSPSGSNCEERPYRLANGESVFDISVALDHRPPRRSDSGVAGTSLRFVAAEKRLVRARTDDDGGG